MLISSSKQDIGVWISYSKFLFKHSDEIPPESVLKRSRFLTESPVSKKDKTEKSKNAKKLLSKALNVLDKRLHFQFLLRFAKTEFLFGSKIEARQTFSDLLQAHQRNSRAWGTLIDLETDLLKKNSGSSDQKEICRVIFEKALSADLPLKEVKFVFSRYLDFADQFCSEKEVLEVKNKAREYALKMKNKN
ncbi:Protein RRP5 [Bonamia ostreae]|uniref:Protein RRP5 n=1 Tax=Bonamia ostreae TaxID=126728 RepID=A0ABV2ASG6_9EUKA